jgi:hypothetical protein
MAARGAVVGYAVDSTRSSWHGVKANVRQKGFDPDAPRKSGSFARNKDGLHAFKGG